jgi:NAD-dependent deacetylase
VSEGALESDLREAALRLRRAQQVVVFTGAGVSAESGIATFRDEGGFWERFPPERFAHVPGLLATLRDDPARLAEFFREVIAPIAEARPNPAHRAIAAFEAYVPVVVVTQNVDGLHQEAGSTHVHEIHGSLLAVRSAFGGIDHLGREDLQKIGKDLQKAGERASRRRLLWALRRLLGVSHRGTYRPDVVMFGEPLREPDWTLGRRAVHESDVLLVVGTSGLVMPAAGLPSEARARGAKVIQIDPHPPDEPVLWLQGKAGEVLPALLHEAFGAGLAAAGPP